MRPFLALVLLALLPTANAGTPAGDVYLMTGPSAILLEVGYADGLASTKFGFVQLVGQGGGPTQRLEAGSLCTEWHGAFSQVLVQARESDGATNATLLVAGHLATPAAGPSERQDVGYVLDALGGATAFEGRLTVCDDAEGGGSVLFSASVRPTPLARANPAIVRVTPEA